MMNPPTSIQALLQAGVFDLRSELPTFRVAKPDRAHAIGTTGFQTMIGPFIVDSFAAALKTIVVSSEPVFSEAEPIDLRYVLAQPWRHDRMTDSLRLREAGTAPSIDVNRITVPGRPDFFEIMDGCHRSFAARRHGDSTIQARIQSHHHADPTGFMIVGSTLMLRSDAANGVCESKDGSARHLGLDMIAILTALGCQGTSAPAMPWSFGP